MLRKLAIVSVVLALVAAWLGRQPGRLVARDVARCDLQLVLRVPGEFVDELKRLGGVERESRCEPEIRQLERPAAAVEAQLALLAIALAGVVTIVRPRAWAAGASLVVAATAGVLAFVLTRGFDIGADETTYRWTYYAGRIAIGAVAACQAAIFGWLVTHDEREPIPRMMARWRGYSPSCCSERADASVSTRRAR